MSSHIFQLLIFRLDGTQQRRAHHFLGHIFRNILVQVKGKLNGFVVFVFSCKWKTVDQEAASRLDGIRTNGLDLLPFSFLTSSIRSHSLMAITSPSSSSASSTRTPVSSWKKAWFSRILMAYLRGWRRADNVYVREELAVSAVGTEEFLCLSRERRVGTGFSQVAPYKKNSWPHAGKVKRLRADLARR